MYLWRYDHRYPFCFHFSNSAKNKNYSSFAKLSLKNPEQKETKPEYPSLYAREKKTGDICGNGNILILLLFAVYKLNFLLLRLCKHKEMTRRSGGWLCKYINLHTHTHIHKHSTQLTHFLTFKCTKARHFYITMAWKWNFLACRVLNTHT